MLEGRTGVATVLALANYVAYTGFLTNTARLGADRPGRPARNPAVDRADTDGAGTGLGCRRASLATIAGGSENVAGALLVTKATGLVAGRPGTEFFHEAVNGTGLFVAGNLFRCNTTEVATELSLSDNLAGASHGATTAGNGASAVLGPGGELAVYRALHGFAGFLVKEIGANNTARGSLASDGALAEGSATTAGLGAS